MPAIQNLVLKDGKTTPVNHTFTPSDVSAGVGEVVESDGTLVGEKMYTISGKVTTAGRWSAKGKLTVPVVATQVVNGVSSPVIVRKAFAEVTFSFAPDSSLDERKDAIAMLRDSLDPAKWPFDVFANMQGVYGS